MTHRSKNPRGPVAPALPLLARDASRRAKVKRLTESSTSGPARNDLRPELRLVDRDPATLTVPARAVRKLDAAHVRAIANSITTLGFTVPVIIDAADVVVDGVARVAAAKQLGLPTVPCVSVEHLSARDTRLLRLAVNRLSELGEWDLDELKVEFRDLVIENAPIEISGFALTEIDSILLDPEPHATDPGPLTPDESLPAIAQVGDIFVLGCHRVICGDARDPEVLEKLMGADRARFVFTDQPYNVKVRGHVTRGRHREFATASGEMSASEFEAFNKGWIEAALFYLQDDGVLATFIDWRGLVSVSLAATAARLSQINLVVWAKTNAGMGSLYRSQHELLPLFAKPSAEVVNNVDLGKKGRWRSNLWTYPGASSLGSDARRGLQDHPTVKPVLMVGDAMLDLTNRGEVVLDPFLGSGSTLIAAEQKGRVCRGVEIDPLYVDLIIRRFEAATGQQAKLEATGQSFADIRAQRSNAGDATSGTEHDPTRPHRLRITRRKVD